MLNPDTLAWRDELILTRDIAVAGDRAIFYDKVRKREFVSLRRGVYVAEPRWRGLDAGGQYRLRVLAAVAYSKRPLIVSHVSAACLWDLPWFSPYPRAIHALEHGANGGRSSAVVARHTVGIPDEFESIEGVLVTSLSRTVVDVARSTSFAQAVAVADAALRRTFVPWDGVPSTTLTRDDFLQQLERLPLSQGTAKARRVLEFANGSADRPGESISRVNMSLAKLTPPELQVALRGASGRRWHVDFWWPVFNLIGEFDGKAKYTDERYLRGRTPQEALYEEKLREDDLRAAKHEFTRWPWEVATSMPRLRAHLIAAGLR